MNIGMLNPYQPTSQTTESDPNSLPKHAGIQIALLAIAVGFVAAYYVIQLQRIPSGRPIALWPTLLVPFSLAMFSAVRPRYTAFAPLTAILGVMTGSMVFAQFRGWAAAEVPISLAIGVTISIPSWIVARRSRAKIMESQVGSIAKTYHRISR